MGGGNSFATVTLVFLCSESAVQKGMDRLPNWEKKTKALEFGVWSLEVIKIFFQVFQARSSCPRFVFQASGPSVPTVPVGSTAASAYSKDQKD